MNRDKYYELLEIVDAADNYHDYADALIELRDLADKIFIRNDLIAKIRCENCRYNDEWYCELHDRRVDLDDYCSWGRKGEN